MNISDQDHMNGPSSDGERKKKTKWLAIAFFLAVLFAAAWYVWQFMQAPAVGTVTRGETKYDLANPDLPPEIRIFEGKYVSLPIPTTYLEKQHETPDGIGTNVLEQAFFTEENLDSRKLAVVVEKRPANGIRELSSFAFRELESETYERDSYEWDGNRIPTFTKSSAVYEITGYIESDSMVASISVSSAIRTPEQLIDDFSDIIKSFRWVNGASR